MAEENLTLTPLTSDEDEVEYEVKKIDYVLVYPKEELVENEELRNRFLEQMKAEDLEFETEEVEDSGNVDKMNIFIKIHTPFYRLCEQAEKIKLEMELRGLEIPEEHLNFFKFFRKIEKKLFVTDDEGLQYLLMKKVFSDSFVMHDESDLDPYKNAKKEILRIYRCSFVLHDPPKENHRTQSQYDDALIVKLFAFQFANSYSSLIYIAFFRGIDYGDNGMFGMGSSYSDSCGTDNNCMAMLSLQLLVLMILKPFPKFFKDVLLILFKRKMISLKYYLGKKIDSEDEIKRKEILQNSFLERERKKPDLNDFTLSEFTEKIIMYGYLMLFAASFPLAPLIALIVCLMDIRQDGKRMLWNFRRPIGVISDDIGNEKIMKIKKKQL
ncbi:DgyrCDS12169 [Dimorphilus gyrociliatus]|uniref:Anoctamin n=1 Tax=Dimorphilus gyrociliatus TaxID=2664684 RepID=A0A7I8W6W8_9ANNE|nr:DgyrCDS12169 [Dimorphilus gyrociliatus]